MDFREIQRLHQQYAQGPLTIDMEGAPITALPAPAARPVPADASRSTVPPGYFVETRKVIALMMIVAAISLPIGMWLASAHKQSRDVAATEPAQGQPGSPEVPDSGSMSTRWPEASASTSVEPAQQASPVIAAPPVAGTPSRSASQVPAPAAVPTIASRAAPHEPKPVVREPRKPDAPVRAPSSPQKPAASAGEIKLF